MELYLDLVSPPCRAVYLFAKALGISFEFKQVELSAGQQYSEEFEKLSIVRKIPLMKDGDFVLTESTAILKYLVQKSSLADHWFPADLQQRARVNEYLSWQHMNLRAHCSKVFLLRALFPFVMGSEPTKERMDIALEDMKKSIDLLEEKFLQNKPFILGNKISLADVVAVVELMQAVGTGVNCFEGRPRLIAWRDRVKKELGEKLFDQAHEAIMDPSAMQQKMQNNPVLDALKPTFHRLFR
ncbi:glutathione S-transferase theta-1a [Cololabis saira]|uniref:glutathione S-transferase theta-1a n=1 Tax=Cololabis saira TaxID=129043 RepID=UPI002AD2152D|nr:glutathione S-transferase theta-1a [Cololabis saira]